MVRFRIILCLSLVLVLLSSYNNSNPVLTQKMLDTAKNTFVVKKHYDLLGKKIVIPRGVCVSFDGGSVNNGVLFGNMTEIQVKRKQPIFGVDMIISGTWKVPEVHDGWFEFNKSPLFVSNQIINNMLAFSNDNTFCHILFEENRTYYFKLPYCKNDYLGELVSYKTVNGIKKRSYLDLLKDDFSFLRIFTISSNTRLTINNTWQMLPTNMGAYFVFWEKFKENITIDGRGKICGDAKTHLYTQPFNIDSKSYFGEWGTIFELISCKNLKFSDITIESAFGDCVYFSSIHTEGVTLEKQIASGLLMDNVKIRYGRRNGIVIGARDVIINNCLFENCGIDEIKGTQPWAAIDFESDDFSRYKDFYCDNIQMINCTFHNNRIDVNSSDVTYPDFGKYAVTITNCTFPNPVSINSSHWMHFVNCYFSFLKSGKNSFSMFTNSSNMLFDNCTFKKIDKVRQLKSKLNGNKFNNCTVLD